MRKKRKVSSVMGWLLSFQLSDPGEGVCWAVSIVCGGLCESGAGEDGFHVLRGIWLRVQERVGESAFAELAGSSLLPRTS